MLFTEPPFTLLHHVFASRLTDPAYGHLSLHICSYPHIRKDLDSRELLPTIVFLHSTIVIIVSLCTIFYGLLR